jgi:hypothetical protein
VPRPPTASTRSARAIGSRPRWREQIEAQLHESLPYATLFTHIEPVEDPRSFDDTKLHRASRVAR